MNVFYKFYRLQSLKAPNRLSSSSGTKTGVHLRVKMRWSDHFADYFPHVELGDKDCELFLEKFKYQDEDYEKKIFYFLLEDERLRSQRPKTFLNHQWWDGKGPIEGPVLKYKIQAEDDRNFEKAQGSGIRLRLDANGLFSPESFKKFETSLDPASIEYIEDPMAQEDWSASSLPLARDFIHGTPYQFLVHKPNSRFFPETQNPVIFSSYFGSGLGNWQAYGELLDKGDLTQHHGLLSPGLYQGEKILFKGSYKKGFLPDESVVKSIYQDLIASEWKLLCSI